MVAGADEAIVERDRGTQVRGSFVEMARVGERGAEIALRERMLPRSLAVNRRCVGERRGVARDRGIELAVASLRLAEPRFVDRDVFFVRGLACGEHGAQLFLGIGWLAARQRDHRKIAAHADDVRVIRAVTLRPHVARGDIGLLGLVIVPLPYEHRGERILRFAEIGTVRRSSSSCCVAIA